MSLEIDFVASEPHFADHLAPIAHEALRRGLQTRFFVGDRVGEVSERHPGLIFTLATPETASDDGPITVCAAIVDASNAVNHHRRVVLIEHGAGQSYSDRNSSYVGGEGRERLLGVMVPNATAAARHIRFYPRGPGVIVVGSPRVEALVARFGRFRGDSALGTPTVAVSWHWECSAVPETGSAFPDLGPGVLHELQRLERLGWIKLVGHQHPRATKPVRAYAELGIPFLESFEEVCERADVYMVDNSSTLFEFAALDRPVIVMNSPDYRRRVDHGLRFWSAASIGPNVWRQRDVAYAVASAIEDGPARQAERRRIVEEVYGCLDGQAAAAACDAIATFDRVR